MTKYTHIDQSQLDGAKIYSNRWSWAASLKKNMDIIEVGVGSGDYSLHMMQTISPKSMLLIDQYDQSDPMIARPNQPLRFKEENHYQFIQDKFKDYSNVTLNKGNSIEVLPKLIEEQKSFDMIYIDASHHYEDSSEDIWNASKLLRDDGILAINDYVHFVHDEQYGVILATNEFLNKNKDWKVVGLSLEENMMADIYLSKNSFDV